MTGDTPALAALPQAAGRPPRTVAVIGRGTIGAVVGEHIAAGAVPGLRFLGYLVRRPEHDDELHSLDELLEQRPDVVVEAAGHEALSTSGERVLAAGADLVCVSLGALGDDALRRGLEASARDGGGRLILVSGATGGLDLIRAALVAGLEQVEVEQSKPASVVLPPAEAIELRDPAVVFDGPVREVVRRYPLTSNSAAAVALAGLGFDRTRARVIADPRASANHMCVRARGSFGHFTLEFQNTATRNPRTSTVAAMSVIAALRNSTGPMRQL